MIHIKCHLKLFMLSLFLLSFLIATGEARSEILLGSAGQNIISETVIFTLRDDDILAWEESGEGKYIYFTLNDQKNEELSEITTEYLGHPMRIELEDTFILVPEITAILNQKQGFVLKVGKGRRLEMLRLLGKDKEQKSATKIGISTGTKLDSPEEE